MIPILVPTVLAKRPVTNRHLNSNTFSGYTPTAGVVTQTTGYGTGNDGTQTTTRWQVDTSTRVMRFTSANTGLDATSTLYCVSLFYRGAFSSFLSVAGRAGLGAAPVDMGVVGPADLRRWYVPITTGTNTAFLDMTVAANADIEVWGIQVEKGVSVPGRHVPTGAAAATAWV